MTRTIALAILIIAASMITGLTIASVPTLAVKSPPGINTADENVHSNTPGGLGGQQDTNFHVGICNGGITTSVLNSIGGCSFVPKPSQCHAQHEGALCSTIP